MALPRLVQPLRIVDQTLLHQRMAPRYRHAYMAVTGFANLFRRFFVYRHIAPRPLDQRAILLFDLVVTALIIAFSLVSAWLVFGHVEGGEDSIWGHVLAATLSYLIVLFGLHLACWIRNCILFRSKNQIPLTPAGTLAERSKRSLAECRIRARRAALWYGIIRLDIPCGVREQALRFLEPTFNRQGNKGNGAGEQVRHGAESLKAAQCSHLNRRVQGRCLRGTARGVSFFRAEAAFMLVHISDARRLRWCSGAASG